MQPVREREIEKVQPEQEYSSCNLVWTLCSVHYSLLEENNGHCEGFTQEEYFAKVLHPKVNLEQPPFHFSKKFWEVKKLWLPLLCTLVMCGLKVFGVVQDILWVPISMLLECLTMWKKSFYYVQLRRVL